MTDPTFQVDERRSAIEMSVEIEVEHINMLAVAVVFLFSIVCIFVRILCLPA